ncbi:MAG: hypothetical protein MK193_06245 [Lentisphaeria bacterium]|nr:hypothetical protein [Lentisphaeria bacterium]
MPKEFKKNKLMKRKKQFHDFIKKLLGEDFYQKRWVRNQQRSEVSGEGVFIKSRGDRYGSNVAPWLNAIALAEITGEPLFHNCDDNCYQFRNSLMHQYIYDHSQSCDPTDHLDMNAIDQHWMLGQSITLLKASNNIPLPDLLERSGLKDKLVQVYNDAAVKRGWNQNFNYGKFLAIHVRLDDMNYKNAKTYPCGYIGDTGLIELVNLCHTKYPEHEIHLITTPNPNDISRCKDILKESNITSRCHVIANKDMDQDIYHMMRSDILIMSRSTFAFVPGFLHQGTKVYSYAKWLQLYYLIGPKFPGIETLVETKKFHYLWDGLSDESSFANQYESPWDEVLGEALSKYGVEIDPCYIEGDQKWGLAVISPKKVKVIVDHQGSEYVPGKKFDYQVFQNLATIPDGWQVAHFTIEQIHQDLKACVDQVKALF